MDVNNDIFVCITDSIGYNSTSWRSTRCTYSLKKKKKLISSSIAVAIFFRQNKVVTKLPIWFDGKIEFDERTRNYIKFSYGVISTYLDSSNLYL